MLLTFTQMETELPADECQGPALPTRRPCVLQACAQSTAAQQLLLSPTADGLAVYDWEYAGFTPCTATCWGGSRLHTPWGLGALGVAGTRVSLSDSSCCRMGAL